MNLQELLNGLNPEQQQKLTEAQSAEKLSSVAKGFGCELTMEEAALCFAQLSNKNGEMPDEMLDGVNGGYHVCQFDFFRDNRRD